MIENSFERVGAESSHRRKPEAMLGRLAPNPSVERTSTKRLRRFAAAAHVKR